MYLSNEFLLEYEGILIPRETHSLESLKFAQDFKFKDDDVVAYPACNSMWVGFSHHRSSDHLLNM
uniref:Uncharacterized protein n=1 Tax=Oryzias sinensis TaxID=183150 RepID=A0A8C7X8T9_9TELE